MRIKSFKLTFGSTIKPSGDLKGQISDSSNLQIPLIKTWNI